MKTTEEMIAVMKAYVDGKTIECHNNHAGDDGWYPVYYPSWDWSCCSYRVKEEPKYVPYDSVTEVNIDKWFRRKDNSLIIRKVTIINYAKEWIYLEGSGWYTMKELFEECEYNDGTPCGKPKGE